MTGVHLVRDIKKIKKNIVQLCGEVQKRLCKAVDSFIEEDIYTAGEVVDKDFEIDEMEVSLEEEILKVLALHQPVASDLRFLIAILKINNDIERIGDLAVNISKRTLKFKKSKVENSDHSNLREITRIVIDMVKKSLESLIEEDVEKAGDIIFQDEMVDQRMDDLFEEIKEQMLRKPENIEGLLSKASVYRHIERIGDHATNIAEDIIYFKEGVIVRHNEFPKKHKK
jgi:phosphate transport system protein